MFYQQGDVILEVVESVQGNEQKKHNGRVAEGEATGHHHSFVIPKNVRFFRRENQELFIDVLRPTNLGHQEHKGIIIPTGKYRVRIVREYDHFAEEARNVQD